MDGNRNLSDTSRYQLFTLCFDATGGRNRDHLAHSRYCTLTVIQQTILIDQFSPIRFGVLNFQRLINFHFRLIMLGEN
jgi:hypothetical protein